MKEREITMKKNIHAIALGRKGGKARLKTMSAKQRRTIAKKAISVRWGKNKQTK